MSRPGAEHRSGYIAIVGRPNVGKSTLLNALVGQKVSIITHKPQTTRHPILGICSQADVQMVFIDTPGYHLKQKHAINHYMNKAALSALRDADVVLFTVQAERWTEEDQALLEQLKSLTQPVIAVINKVDRLADKNRLLEYLAQLNPAMPFRALVPVSARLNDGIDILQNEIRDCLPVSPPFFESDQVTDRSLRFLAAEEIREKLFLHVHDELPYCLAVEIEDFTEEKKLCRIRAVIWVERSSHKGMVIGRGGARLKAVGRDARQSLEKAFGRKVFLELWVKVKEGWSDDERALQSLGYQDTF